MLYQTRPSTFLKKMNLIFSKLPHLGVTIGDSLVTQNSEKCWRDELAILYSNVCTFFVVTQIMPATLYPPWQPHPCLWLILLKCTFKMKIEKFGILLLIFVFLFNAI